MTGAFGKVTTGLLKEDLEVRGRVGTAQTTILLRMARILRGVPETCCHSNSNERPSTFSYTDVKNSQGVNNKYLNLVGQMKKHGT